MLLLPDILLGLLPFVVIAVDLIAGPRRGHRPSFHAAWIGLAVVLAAQALFARGGGDATYLHAYRVSGWSMLLKPVFVLAALLAVWLSDAYFRAGGNRRGRLTRPGDFYTLLVVATGGMIVVVSARELVTMFLGLEMATIRL